jgi:isopenicillin N synthase-like dioxygenase
MSDAIPTISLTGLRSRRRGDLVPIAAEIGTAARGLGFFSVADHGIDPALLAAVFDRSPAFFALPQADKDRLSVGVTVSVSSASGRGTAKTRWPRLLFDLQARSR